jgi:hypothetical protein
MHHKTYDIPVGCGISYQSTASLRIPPRMMALRFSFFDLRYPSNRVLSSSAIPEFSVLETEVKGYLKHREYP